tara:strand:+ start:300 stop:500 length:201 start_codon:yes stop_codon:yes gene_type:complete
MTAPQRQQQSVLGQSANPSALSTFRTGGSAMGGMGSLLELGHHSSLNELQENSQQTDYRTQYQNTI